MTSERRSEFVAAVNALVDWEDWGEGPLCECDSWSCAERLPLEAWRFVYTGSQFVVFPGHEKQGNRLVEKDGFNIEEGDGE